MWAPLLLTEKFPIGGVVIFRSQALKWLHQQRETLEQTVNASLALTGVMAAAFYDLGFTEHQAEMLFLVLRLPSAAVFALEQQQLGWRKFPFFGEQIQLANDCGVKE